MLERLKCLGDVPGHGDIQETVFIVPDQFETEVGGTRPVCGVSVTSGEGSKKVFGVSLGEVFYSEIVDGECESGRFGGVVPETGSVGYGGVAKRCEVSSKLIVGQDGGFLEAIHAFADFNVGVSFGVEVGRGKLVLFLDVLWYVFAVDSHILVNCHVAHQKEVFQVGCAISGATVGIGDDTVPVEFGVDETDGRGANILVGIQ